MDENLRAETDLLIRSWDRHAPEFLRDYLVASVEDPRLNAQSILTRHFLITSLFGTRFAELMEQELLFAAAMAWLRGLDFSDAEELAAIRHALSRGADNAEGRPLPRFVAELFGSLPLPASGLPVPNYLDEMLTQPTTESRARGAGTFQRLWAEALASIPPANPKPVVLEPACGSANDYRFLGSYGLARLIDYRGFDLSEKNVANALELFPDAAFAVGNVFCIGAPDRAMDYLFVHDLFEHLSLAGLEQALREVCRVTRHSLCLGFFSMDERDGHLVRPLDEYHWNTLSMEKVKGSLAVGGFETQVFHIDTYFRWLIPGQSTHNPNAYTLIARRPADSAKSLAGSIR